MLQINTQALQAESVCSDAGLPSSARRSAALDTMPHGNSASGCSELASSCIELDTKDCSNMRTADRPH